LSFLPKFARTLPGEGDSKEQTENTVKTLGKLIVAGLIVFVLLQLLRPGIPAKPARAELQAPPEVRQVFEKSCYSCHSDQRRLSWFDYVVPGYWLVRHDILTAREHLNFSTLGAKPAAAQKATLYEAVNMIQLGAMPLPRFLSLHSDAKVTPAELTTLKTYLAPWTPVADAQAGSAEPPARVSLATVQPELNGFAFDPTFESWKPISTTDRGDNHTFRIIAGNDVAVKAAQAGNISPWPDGSRFAKITWQQQPGVDGLVHPGTFVQVELMLKNAGDYKDTEGWGWGRWRGAALKPYGNDAHFLKECTGCHQPLRGNDYVYTTPITTAKVSGVEVVNNAAAALPATLPFQPLGWGAITMYVDPAAHSTATLYGNDAAMQAVQALRAVPASAPAYPPGAVLALVTWAQREDPHWFGARIPDRPLSVEFVEASGSQPAYRRFAGAELTAEQNAAAAQRTSFILGLPPAWLP
jgi:mono/diheme cytochrome c family protein